MLLEADPNFQKMCNCLKTIHVHILFLKFFFFFRVSSNSVSSGLSLQSWDFRQAVWWLTQCYFYPQFLRKQIIIGHMLLLEGKKRDPKLQFMESQFVMEKHKGLPGSSQCAHSLPLTQMCFLAFAISCLKAKEACHLK